MSPPDANTAPEAPPRPTGRPRKATLYCPECSHASPVDGDWNYRTRSGPGVEEVRCPCCRARIAERPLPESRERGVSYILRRSEERSPGETLAALTRFWTATVSSLVTWSGRTQC